MKLEDARNGQHVGDVGYWQDEGHPKPFLFHGYATAAVALTTQGLNQFQKIQSLGANPYVMPGILWWFHTAESLISTILKVLNDYAARVGEQPLTTSLKVRDKLEAIQTQLKVDRGEARSLVNRFSDFTTVRNRLSHDLTNEKKAPLHHAAFVGEVSQANEIDLLEACAISISVCSHLRSGFAGSDLMPSVQVGERFVKADRVAEEVLFPSFNQIIEMKGLETSFVPKIDKVPLGTELLIPFQVLISSEGPSAPNDSSEKQSSVTTLMEALTSSLPPVSPDKFELPNYVRPE